MATTETSVTQLKINKLTKAQYDSITTPSATELYFVKDEAIDYNDLINTPDLATVATTGDYEDLINLPQITQSNWDQNDSTQIDYIKNKPDIPTTTDSITSGSNAALTSGGAYTNLVSNVTSNGNNILKVTKNGITNNITIDNVTTATNAINATTATTASKLGSTTVGGTTTPIYLNAGTPTALSYTIAKSVPADAKFTDHEYSIFSGASASSAGTAGLVKAPTAGQQDYYLKGDGNWSSISVLPSQSGHSGEYLMTNGTAVSWAAVATLPTQSGQSGKYLTTNGTTASWANIPTEIPSQSGNSGKFLTTNGTAVSWATVNALPSQSGNSGKFLTTNGTTASWGEISEYTANEVETLWNSL